MGKRILGSLRGKKGGWGGWLGSTTFHNSKRGGGGGVTLWLIKGRLIYKGRNRYIRTILTSCKPTWQWKLDHFKMYFLSKTEIFQPPHRRNKGLIAGLIKGNQWLGSNVKQKLVTVHDCRNLPTVHKIPLNHMANSDTGITNTVSQKSATNMFFKKVPNLS